MQKKKKEEEVGGGGRGWEGERKVDQCLWKRHRFILCLSRLPSLGEAGAVLDLHIIKQFQYPLQEVLCHSSMRNPVS